MPRMYTGFGKTKTLRLKLEKELRLGCMGQRLKNNENIEVDGSTTEVVGTPIIEKVKVEESTTLEVGTLTIPNNNVDGSTTEVVGTPIIEKVKVEESTTSEVGTLTIPNNNVDGSTTEVVGIPKDGDENETIYNRKRFLRCRTRAKLHKNVMTISQTELPNENLDESIIGKVCRTKNVDVKVLTALANGSSTIQDEGVYGSMTKEVSTTVNLDLNMAESPTLLSNSQSVTENVFPEPETGLYDKKKLGWGNSCYGDTCFGLKNLGNTCYMNSIFQALFSLPVFARWLESEVHTHCADTDDEGSCIICGINSLITSNGDETILRGINLFLLTIAYPLIIKNRQEDAHEFLLILFAIIRETFDSQCEIQIPENDELSLRTNPIDEIFGGYVQSTIKCSVCHTESMTIQSFNGLELVIDNENINSVNDAIKEYFRNIVIGYRCDCYLENQAKSNVLQVYRIQTYPHVLCIQLKFRS
ncbi:Ubiquitin carboxyl-terminal hydrolase 36 [Pseudolycoriella hygida]|uniref:Ubiquitin carboxyl-terminal hydrolase 36 n=1 Tax=Pseudolycoriella hygida TaxID=35572 RepID=A0A9Q0NGV4_9DIPT|nr:Ubiquitin carboxyl-terminal hydrolase 36 [Pseudolycoriella hygida]